MATTKPWRECDHCGSKMLPWQPRKRTADGSLVCGSCHETATQGLPQERTGAKTAADTLKCQHCDWEGYTPAQRDQHHRAEHPGLRVHEPAGVQTTTIPPGMAEQMHEHGQHRTVNLEDPDDLRQHLAEAHGWGSTSDLTFGNVHQEGWGNDWDERTVQRTGHHPLSYAHLDDLHERHHAAGEPGFTDDDGTHFHTASKTAVRKEAIDTSGIIRRCPFCGSGQVIQRSDGTTNCSYCDTSFIVTMMPNIPAIPTFVGGEDLDVDNNQGPYDVPAEEMEAAPMGGDPMAFVPPGQDPAAAQGAGGSGAFVPPDGSQDGAEADASPNKIPVAASLMMRTAKGHLLPPDEYVRHLAIEAASPEERPHVIARIREERRAS